MTGFEPLLVERDWNRASPRDWATVLREVPLFSSLGNRDIRRLARTAEFAEFASGEAVINVGEPGGHLFVILSGEAEVRARSVVRTLHAGDHFGELALLGDGLRSATVVAKRALHVMRLPGKVFLDVVERNPDLALSLATELGLRLRAGNRRLNAVA